jgi:dipeptidyl aminopeptidase/acylaminoacyl peptidase
VPLDGAAADHLVGATADTRLWLSAGRLVQRGRSNRPLLEGAAVTATSLHVPDLAEAGGRVLFNPPRTGPVPILFNRSGTASLGYYDPDGGALSWTLPLPSPSARVFALARRGAAISLAADEHGLGRLILSRVGQPDVELDQVNRHLADVDPVSRIAVQAPGPDGRPLTHWLSLPPRSGPETPLVVIPYPGLVRLDGPPPPIDFANFTTVVSPALLTGAGYAVLEPSVPMPADTTSETLSSSAAGATFNLRSRTIDGDPGEAIAQTVEAAVDAAGRTGRASATDVAVYGHSFGGWAAVEIAEHSRRPRAIIAAAGPYDYFAPYGFIPPTWDYREIGTGTVLAFSLFEAGPGNVGGPPWRVAMRYLERSPLYAADRITAPLMLIHGNLDFMPDASAGRLLMAMHRLGRDAVFLRYGGESHMLNSPANIRDQWARMRAFLDRYLRSVDEAHGAQ